MSTGRCGRRDGGSRRAGELRHLAAERDQSELGSRVRLPVGGWSIRNGGGGAPVPKEPPAAGPSAAASAGPVEGLTPERSRTGMRDRVWGWSGVSLLFPPFKLLARVMGSWGALPSLRALSSPGIGASSLGDSLPPSQNCLCPSLHARPVLHLRHWQSCRA